MGDMLGNALSALTSYQRAMATSSHNIANADTEGYSRQRVEFATRTPETYGAGSIGSGVTLSGIRRIYDEFAGSQLRDATASFSQLDSYYQLAFQLDNVLADPETGLSAAISRFYNSIQDVADDPGSISTRQLMLAEAESLSGRIADIEAQMEALNKEVNLRMTSSVAEINDLTGQIAELNKLIVESSGGYGQAPNDLLDQRDQAVLQLNELIGVKTVTQSDGSLNVFISNGESLVLGADTTELVALNSPYDPNRVELALRKSGGDAIISDIVSGGVLGGIMDFRDGVLSDARSELGLISIALADSLNQQNRAGMDLRGNLGSDIFGLPGPEVFTSRNNTGTASVDAQISDLGALTGDNILMRYNGSNWNFYYEGGKAPVPGVTGTGTLADPFVVDGVSLVVSNTPATGDEFVLRPTMNAAAGLDVLITDPSSIAAAAATRSSAEAGNTGSGLITQTEVIDSTDPALLGNIEIQFTSATTYQINGSGSFSYTSGQAIDINGNRVTITGSPANGDRFYIEANYGGSGDNRNALKLGQTESLTVLNGGASSLQDAISKVVGDVAVATRSAEVNRQSQQNMLAQAEARMEEISGVNLDEEAANLLKFQQAYQAAAKAASAANDMFQALMAAFR